MSTNNNSKTDVRLVEIKKTLSDFVKAGRLDSELIRLISRENQCIPLECELLDYKEKLESDKVSYAKALIRIIALYNTYGGYLIFGVAEISSEVDFKIVGISTGSLDIERLKAMLKEYTGERIPITLQYLSHPSLQDGLQVAVIFIPKRKDPEPLCFGKTGPEDGKKPIFTKDDSFYRKGDECLLVKGKAALFLAGPRNCPYEESDRRFGGLLKKNTHLINNLPDRSFICPRFVGRKDEIDQLWAWFSDDFSHVRVLAGEGGLGKTSIAYQFAEDICAEIESGLERVLWLTAKKHQFSGISNDAIDVPETHYNTYDNLLNTLCSEFGFLDDELSGASEKLLKKYIQQGARITPSLVVVDDVDSLSPEEQRRVLEIGFLFGGTKSRLLLTTRVNQSYSSDIAIQVSGFDWEEYKTYIETLNTQYSFVKLTDSQLKTMFDTTAGSPLFSQSLYRLFRFMAPGNAIQEWRGEKGEDARAAALRREVEQLSPEAKRALLAATLLKECSFSELSEITGYSEQVLRDAIVELRSLYLLDAPRLTAEERFHVSLNTRQFIIKTKDTLAIDHVKLEHLVKNLRSHGGTKISKDNAIVGAAINQAIAQIKRQLIQDALETIGAAEKKCKNHPDLLAMRARCLMQLNPAKPDEARRAARKAYEAGSKKEILYEIWYQAEWDSNHFIGAQEAADCWINISKSEDYEWLIRRAAALWNIAKELERSNHIDRAISEFWACDENLSSAYNSVNNDEQKDIRRRQFEIHDSIWNIFSNSTYKDIDISSRSIDAVRKMISKNDYRITNYLRLCDVLTWLNSIISRKDGNLTSGLRNVIEQRYREVRGEINAFSKKNKTDARLLHIEEKFNSAYNEFEKLIKVHEY